MNTRAAVAAILVAAAAAAAADVAAATTTRPSGPASERFARPRQAVLARPAHTGAIVVSYTAHTGRTRLARVLLPRWYGPHRHPAIPLVISPHGRSTDGTANARLWGDLPGIGGFAVVNPDGEGDHLGAYSWGAPGQIEDLARMPALVAAALPWLAIDHTRIYAVGGSMGGQETLLLLARHPRLLAGAAAFDAVADFAHQYREFPRLPCSALCRSQLGTSLGDVLGRLARTEIGGDPKSMPFAYARRSPLTYARAIARSCVPLQLWWSDRDRIVVDPSRQSARLLAVVRHLNPTAAVDGFEGRWVHSAEMRAATRLPFALARLGLLPPRFDGEWGTAGTRVTPRLDGRCNP